MLASAACTGSVQGAAADASAELDAGAAADAGAVTSTIEWRGGSQVAFPGGTELTLEVPANARPGDLLVAGLAFGRADQTAQPSVQAPAGWTLVERAEHGTVGALAVYWRVAAAGDSSFTWTSSGLVYGVGYMLAYGGVDTSSPIDSHAFADLSSGGSSIQAPSVTTSAAGERVLALFGGYNDAGAATTWSAAGTTGVRVSVNDGSARSGAAFDLLRPSAGATGNISVTASAPQDYASAVTIALKPGTATPPVGAPQVQTSALPSGTVGAAYSATLQATGGTPPYSWAVVSGSLPGGLTLDGDAIAGTPTTAATSNFTVKVTDSAGQSDSKALSIQVSASGNGTLPPPATWSLEQWKSMFLAEWPSDYSSTYLPASQSADSGRYYFLGYGLDTAVNYYLATGETTYIETALGLVENMIADAHTVTSVDGDAYPSSNGYVGWTHPSNGVGSGVWAANLGEGMCWRFVTKLLRVIKQNPDLYSAYADRYASILAFSEKNIFQKWWTFDSSRAFIYRENSNMASLFGMIAFDLSLLTTDATWKASYDTAWQTIAGFDRECLGSDSGHANTSILFQYPDHSRGVMDTDHSGQVHANVVELYEQGAFWTSSDLAAMANMVKLLMWNGSNDFSVNVDGSGGDIGPGYAVIVADAVGHFGQFDPEIQRELELYSESGTASWLVSSVYAMGALNYQRLTGH